MRNSKYILMITILMLLIGISACTSASETGSAGVVIAAGKAGDLTVTLKNARGEIREGDNEFTIEFTDAAGQPVDVGAITMFFDMPSMGSMPYMKNEAMLTTTSTPGIYRGQARVEMKGTWQTKLNYRGAAGEGQTTFTVNVK